MYCVGTVEFPIVLEQSHKVTQTSSVRMYLSKTTHLSWDRPCMGPYLGQKPNKINMLQERNVSQNLIAL